MPFENRIARANGNDFSCWFEGAGDKDIVFIHGEIHGKAYWEPQILEFMRDHRCLAYDRRGHHGSDNSTFGYSVENQTRDLRALLDHFGMQRPRFVALAFGTTIAANFANQNPERVESMLIGAWSELHDALSYLERWEVAGRRSAATLEAGGKKALVELLRREGGKTMYMVIPPEGDPMREPAIELMASHSAAHYRSGMLEVASSVPDLIPRFEKLDIPVLGICGADDPFKDNPEVLAGMRNFREAGLIEGGGRFVHWQQPETFNSIAREFLDHGRVR
ncbi:alpha/beta fold hydrolase [Oceanibacterium hippocampi]|uniref:3-oxoadipate enol-lactonase 2 n=1 Tax=Oceanibacterium hippocampi TaxID=745714 RepID=A0A1Y5TZA0_9PROT|nr:alpha/beta hydrolase [Oceanibacterium hippocampi]SLN76560.1 3-oxoadipate enol-lactonase 2 [Oceanibacterium hippocampi]